MRRLFAVSWFVYALILSVAVEAQPAEKQYKVIVAPDRTDWTYKPGDKAKFTITVLHNGNPVENAKVRYEIGLEKVQPVKKESVVLRKGTLTVDGGTLREPGFLRCIAIAEVDGPAYKGLATAGCDPLNIQPTVNHPCYIEKS